MSASVAIGSGASVNLAKDMHLGSLLSYGFEQIFAAQMGSVRSCLIEDSIPVSFQTHPTWTDYLPADRAQEKRKLPCMHGASGPK